MFEDRQPQVLALLPARMPGDLRDGFGVGPAAAQVVEQSDLLEMGVVQRRLQDP